MRNHTCHFRRFVKTWGVAAAVGLLAGIATSSPTRAETFTMAELDAGATFTVGDVVFFDWDFDQAGSTVNPTIVTVDTIDGAGMPGFRVNGNDELTGDGANLVYQFKVGTTDGGPLIGGAQLTITDHAATSEGEITIELKEDVSTGELGRLELEVFVNDGLVGTRLQDAGTLPRAVVVLPFDAGVKLDLGPGNSGAVRVNSYTTLLFVSPRTPPVPTATGPIPTATAPIPTATAPVPTATSPVPTATPGGPTATPGGPPCVGDCNEDGSVSLGEVQTGLDIFFDEDLIDQCRAADANGSDTVSLGEVQTSLDNFFEDCPTTGTISGQLIVPPNQMVEEEPNEALDEAQDLIELSRVSGAAAIGDPGYSIPGQEAQAEDLYRLNTTKPVRVTLTIGANELFTFDPDTGEIIDVVNDLDLAILDSAGNLVAFSEGRVRNETVDIMMAGEYFIGVRVAAGASPYVVSITPLQLVSPGGAAPAVAAAARPEEFVTGEILVKRKDARSASGQQRKALASGHGAIHVETIPPGVEVLRLGSRAGGAQLQTGQNKLDPSASGEHLLRAATLEMVERLQADPAVAWAQPNYIRRAQTVPNDEFYPKQWHYEKINLPDAWETTTGSDDIIVAVLDTGILSGHPDLAGRLIAGYDFVSSVSRARDGDGIDPDPEDPGDDPAGQSSSFHGTHVSGTVGARSDNLTGVAGVTWQTRIMPVRVLGAGGGTSMEVSQGIRFAGGLSNVSGTLPQERAHVINMSLGGGGTSPIEQDAVLAVRAEGTIVIAAAGNDDSSAPYSPAGLDGVISVSAVGATSKKVSYSNYGDKVDVAAPGGEFWDSDGDDNLDMVLSTIGDDRGRFSYTYYQGTSMASPHMAGVVALMLAVNPELTPEDIDMLLEGTHPQTSTRITIDLGKPGRDDYYGHGLIDAAQAVRAAGELPGGPTPTPDKSKLRLSTESLDFRNFLKEIPFAASNGGTGALTITSVTTDAPWLTAAPASGEAPVVIEVSVDRSGLGDGTYSGSVQVESDATDGPSSASVEVTMTVGGVSAGDVGECLVRILDPDTMATVAEVMTDASRDYMYTTPAVAPGSYIVSAGTDRDGDSEICDIADACGVAPSPVEVSQDVTGVDIVVTESAGPR